MFVIETASCEAIAPWATVDVCVIDKSFYASEKRVSQLFVFLLHLLSNRGFKLWTDHGTLGSSSKYLNNENAS